jgi:glucokinase
MSLTIGVDVGGTKIAAGVVDAKGSIIEMVKRPTPAANASGTIDAISDAVRELLARHEVDVVGIGAAGFVEESRSEVMFAPNLAWRAEPGARQVEERTGRPVIVENDANAAAWGEFRFGAGAGARDVVAVTIGTGIGGGLILDGELYRGAFGIAGEPGHMRVVPGGRLCGCGNHGCWEQYCSGTALVRAAQEIATQRPQDGQRLRQIAGDLDAIDGPAVMSAAQEGDPAAVDCFQEVGRWLGQGLADLAAILDPSRFVVGGGVADAGDLLLGPARDTFSSVLSGRGHRPAADIVGARLGSEAGLIGAADLARHD